MLLKDIEKDIYENLFDLVYHQYEIFGGSPDENRYLKRLLFRTGFALYDSFIGIVYTGSYSGIDPKGRPTTASLRTENGKYRGTFPLSYVPPSDGFGVYLIRWSESTHTPHETIKRYSRELAECRLSAFQNLISCRNPQTWKVPTIEAKASLEKMLRQREDGLPNIVVDSSMSAESIEHHNSYMADSFMQMYRGILAECLQSFGFNTSPDKRERVQNGEVESGVGYSYDMAKTPVDFLNEQFTDYGLPFRCRLRGTIEEVKEKTFNEIENKEDVE